MTHHADHPLERVVAEKTVSVDVIVPTRDVAFAIQDVGRVLVALREAGAIDRAIVIDGASTDGTPELAAAAGLEVFDQAAVLPEHPGAAGKGDALWRSLSLSDADVVCFVDGDSVPFRPEYVLGLVGPLLATPGLRFVRGHFERPFRVGDFHDPRGGGRVTELVAKPLLRLLFPELAVFEQPLAGEFALHREVALQLPFPVGYGVEIATLIDVWRAVGIEAMAQADLGTRQNRHKELGELSPMATEVMVAAMRRSPAGVGLDPDAHPPSTAERPPLATVLGPAVR